ncbi:hypothetical protein PHMEG_00028722 [Phytophthora megakarya]|uniref:Chromo domain-containing protein n=1 Tax=Phytophthora megakarya TaxID=4795 RepID=A0A225V4C7_9STRA|nr:hypothetical protein PHMEG_00028722 [Phytophthora megakarya]
MARRRHLGHDQYLVKWRGYPHLQNSWEFEVPLRQDSPDVVDVYDRVYPRACDGVARRSALSTTRVVGRQVMN